MLRFDLAYSTAKSFSVFSPLAPPFESPFPVQKSEDIFIKFVNNLLHDLNISVSGLYMKKMPESIYFKKPFAKKFGTDLLLLHHFLWPSSPSPGLPSGGERTHQCHWWIELLPAARSRKSGASVGPSHQTWETAGQRKHTEDTMHEDWSVEKF